MGSAEMQDLSPQLTAGQVAAIPSLLHSSEEPRGRTRFLLSSFGGWCLSWGMMPRDHRPGLQLNQTQLPSLCTPTLLFHTNFWQLSLNFYNPGFLKMTISRTTFAWRNQAYALQLFSVSGHFVFMIGRMHSNAETSFQLIILTSHIYSVWKKNLILSLKKLCTST